MAPGRLGRTIDRTTGRASSASQRTCEGTADYRRVEGSNPRTSSAVPAPSGGWAARKLWAMRADLLAGRGRVGKLSFFIHDFMGACALDRERIDACAFMAATADGPVSMCLHNAKRDSFILQPVKLRTAAGEQVWDPLTGDGPRRGRVPPKGQSRRAGTVFRHVGGPAA